MEKPYRFLLDRVASYADEGGAFLRRRRLRGREFARLYGPAGAIEVCDRSDEVGEALFEAASALLEPVELES